MSEVNTKAIRQYKFLTPLAMLYVTAMLASLVLAKRVVEIDGIEMMAASLIFPITFSLADIITEVYGYKITRQFVWCGFGCQLIFVIICAIITPLPAPTFWQHKSEYDLVLGHLFRIFAGSIVGIIIGAFLNIYALSKWKILLKGRYFWLRSLAATAIGESLYTVVALSIMFVGTMPLRHVAFLMLSSYFLKLIYNLITIIPASISAKILKYIEQVDIYDYNVNYNPFSFELKNEENYSGHAFKDKT